MPGTAAEDYLLKQLQQNVDSDPNSPIHHYNLGLFLWKRGEESEGEECKRIQARAADHFLASAKLNPNDGVSFRFLGHYYNLVAADGQRAAKCYQRAIALDPNDSESGEGLCDLLDTGGKESLQIAICKESAEKSPRAFWAFRRLGYLQVHQRKWSEAVQSLQHAIRGYPTCADLWEALGLAYQRLGMFTAAIKSYGRAIELESSRIFSLIESGSIQLMLGSFRKGVEQLHCALEIAPHNLSAQFGLASGLLYWAKHCISFGAFEWGATLLKEASAVVKDCTCLSGNLSSAWKLQGDVQITYAHCFPWEGEKKNIEIDEQNFKASILQWKSACLSAAYSAKISYQRCLHLTPWQANIYSDIAISLDLICSLDSRDRTEPNVWQLPEKMSLGSLMLEAANKDFWVILSCLSANHALKQHSLIRGLQLDIALSEAWAYLGMSYRCFDEKQLATQAFDRARSIDPSLALPWAGMSIEDPDGRIGSTTESFESCLRAVQILPLAEFQVGLGKIAAYSGHLLSPLVLVAIRQAVKRAPYSPEAHNINGLVYEARSHYWSAIAAYRQAKFALNIMSKPNEDIKSRLADVSFNLARTLCKAGLAIDAVRECEDLMKQGLLNMEGLQIYAVALWRIGQDDTTLGVARHLAENVPSMNQTHAVAAIGLITTLIYNILGKNSAVAMIQKFPSQLLQSTRMRFIISSVNALQPSELLQSPLSSMPRTVSSYDVVVEIYSIIALSKMICSESNKNLGINTGVNYLRKALHLFPNSILIRSQLGLLLLSTGEEDRMAPHKAAKCIVLLNGHPAQKGLKSPHQVQGAAVVACYTSDFAVPKFSFPNCHTHHIHGGKGIYHLQRWVHQEPWNQEARYLLVLNLFQKAREERFPKRLCIILGQLIKAALSNDIYLEDSKLLQYQKFLIILSASEISLQSGDYLRCIGHATEALRILPSNSDPFFAHLQLCRVYAIQGKLSSLKNEYKDCLLVGTDIPIGWVMLKYLESRCQLENSSKAIEMKLKACIQGRGSTSKFWTALLSLACAQCFLWDRDHISAEKALAQACAEDDGNSCLLLCHGAICMELARLQSNPEFVSRAACSLRKAQQASPIILPIASLMLAQAEASLGAKAKWERNLRQEWSCWPREMRPPELYFQMHILARQSSTASSKHLGIESSQSSERWLLRAIHLNPSCLRYWKALQKLAAEQTACQF